MRFIYIFEDGTIKQSKSRLSPDDIKAIDEGVLEVIEYNGQTFHRCMPNTDGTFQELDVC